MAVRSGVKARAGGGGGGVVLMKNTRERMECELSGGIICRKINLRDVKTRRKKKEARQRRVDLFKYLL